jgi:hypothetical protein
MYQVRWSADVRNSASEASQALAPAWLDNLGTRTESIDQNCLMTPAMAAGVSNRLWSVEELIAEAAGIARA